MIRQCLSFLVQVALERFRTLSGNPSRFTTIITTTSLELFPSATDSWENCVTLNIVVLVQTCQTIQKAWTCA